MKREETQQEQKLPDGYTSLEYIEGTYKQAIITDLTNANNFWKWWSLTKSNSTQYGTVIHGLNLVSGNNRIESIVSQGINAFDYVCGLGYSRASTQVQMTDTMLDILEEFDKVTINGSSYSLTKKNPHQMSQNVTICGHLESVYSAYGCGKYYGIKIWDENDTLVGDFVPALRNSDNKPGMYDFVSGNFYKSCTNTDFLYS